VKRDLPNFRFRKCDCDLEVNKKECADASFNSGSFVFTATQNEGIGQSVDASSASLFPFH
jgi:hypothetical protein